MVTSWSHVDPLVHRSSPALVNGQATTADEGPGCLSVAPDHDPLQEHWAICQNDTNGISRRSSDRALRQQVNAERLHAIALAVRDDLQTTGVVATLQQLRDALQNQVNAPQEPTYQQQISAALQQLTEALADAPSNSFPPAWQQALEELGVGDLLGAPLAESVREIFERNQITPSVALDAILALTSRLEALAASLDQLLAGLRHLHVGSEDLATGEAEVGILIPRPAIDNELKKLGDEFVELQKLLGPFLEVGTGSRSPLLVRAISSSGPSLK